ncbi:MAG: hypothetical protein ACYS19_06860 [Planctomycetota bacterium]
MVKIKIGVIEKDLEDSDESWINQEIHRLRKGGQPVCVRVRIQTDSLDFSLATPAGGGGRGRQPKPNEQKIFDLWKKRGLTEPDFTGGNLVAFLKQLRNLL